MAIKSKRVKVLPRQRTKYRIRARVQGTEERPRISVFRSGLYTYAQAVCDDTGKTVGTASSREEAVMELAKTLPADGLPNESTAPRGVRAALAVGHTLGKRLQEKNIKNAVFDRNGYRYHGRVRAVADGARKEGIEI